MRFTARLHFNVTGEDQAQARRHLCAALDRMIQHEHVSDIRVCDASELLPSTRHEPHEQAWDGWADVILDLHVLAPDGMGPSREGVRRALMAAQDTVQDDLADRAMAFDQVLSVTGPGHSAIVVQPVD